MCARGVAVVTMPCFPNIKDPASPEEIIARLLETIALEELALAHLINAEAEKLQAVIKAGIVGPVSAEEAKEINLAVSKVLEVAALKEERLHRKLKLILSTQSRPTDHRGRRDEDDFEGP